MNTSLDQVQSPEKLDGTIYAIGRRKSAQAHIYISQNNNDKSDNEITINSKPGLEYLQNNSALYALIESPLKLLNLSNAYSIVISTSGGGLPSQAAAIRLGIARALYKISAESRSVLKGEAMLTRDPRCKERKKYGLKKSRKASQFSKR